jgi:hypothetical protein
MPAAGSVAQQLAPRWAPSGCASVIWGVPRDQAPAVGGGLPAETCQPSGLLSKPSSTGRETPVYAIAVWVLSGAWDGLAHSPMFVPTRR